MKTQTKLWQNFYDHCAGIQNRTSQTARFEPVPVSYRTIADDISKKLHLNGHEHVLDVGCGNGLIDEWLVKSVKKIAAVDLSFGLLRNAKESLKSKNKINFSQAEAEILPFADKSFDVVLFYGVIMHFEKKLIGHLIEELLRVTKNTGRVYIGDCIIPAGLHKKYGQKKGVRGVVSELKALNTLEEHFILPRVIYFLLYREIYKKYAQWKNRRIEAIPDPFEKATRTVDPNYMLKLISEMGYSANMVRQNFRLPYTRFRYDIIIDKYQQN